MLEGKSRYNAAVFEWSKRMTHGCGGRVSYTYSVLKDNQIGEGNFYSAGGGTAVEQLQLHPGAGVRRAAVHHACYNPDADYALQPARRAASRDHRADRSSCRSARARSSRSNSGVGDWLLGGWTSSAAVNLQSGFPLNVQQSDNTGTLLRRAARRTWCRAPTSPPPGSYEDRLASADHPTATWVNPAAFTLAAPFTIGNAPRTITDVRTPPQYNVDVVFIKNIRFGSQDRRRSSSRC